MPESSPRFSQSSSVRIVIADDHAITRTGMRALLESEPGLEVVAEARDGREAVALCGRLQPDVVFMDVRMPDLDGLEATRRIKARHPHIRVIVVTLHENPDYLFEALKAGVAGYLLKDASEDEIIGAAHAVMEGESLLNPQVTARLLKRLAGESAQAVSSQHVQLTQREQDVMRGIVQGLTNRQIADELVVTTGTVKSHVEHIIAKLGVSDRTQAAVRAVELHLVSPSSASGRHRGRDW